MAGRVTEAQAERSAGLLQRLPLRVEAMATPMSPPIAIGRRHGPSAYDAAHLPSPQRRGLPLATLDVRLPESADRAGVADALT